MRIDGFTTPAAPGDFYWLGRGKTLPHDPNCVGPCCTPAIRTVVTPAGTPMGTPVRTPVGTLASNRRIRSRVADETAAALTLMSTQTTAPRNPLNPRQSAVRALFAEEEDDDGIEEEDRDERDEEEEDRLATERLMDELCGANGLGPDPPAGLELERMPPLRAETVQLPLPPLRVCESPVVEIGCNDDDDLYGDGGSLTPRYGSPLPTPSPLPRPPATSPYFVHAVPAVPLPAAPAVNTVNALNTLNTSNKLALGAPTAQVRPAEPEKTVEERTAFCVIDTETTGLSRKDVVLQCGVALFDAEGKMVQCYNRLWLPPKGQRISKQAYKVHKIHYRKLRAEGHPAATQMRIVLNLLRRLYARKVPLVAHNARFDARLLEQTAKAHGVHEWNVPVTALFCTMQTSKRILNLPSKRNPKLVKTPTNQELYRHLYKDRPANLGGAHDALNDCKLTAKCYLAGKKRGWWP